MLNCVLFNYLIEQQRLYIIKETTNTIMQKRFKCFKTIFLVSENKDRQPGQDVTVHAAFD